MNVWWCLTVGELYCLREKALFLMKWRCLPEASLWNSLWFGSWMSAMTVLLTCTVWHRCHAGKVVAFWWCVRHIGSPCEEPSCPEHLFQNQVATFPEIRDFSGAVWKDSCRAVMKLSFLSLPRQAMPYLFGLRDLKYKLSHKLHKLLCPYIIMKIRGRGGG